MKPSRFTRFACFDWSGQAVARPAGIALAIADEDASAPPRLIDHRWSRADVLGWIDDAACRGEPTLIGVDLSPGFPFVDAGAYFPGWAGSPGDARALWALVDSMSQDTPHLGAGGFLSEPEIARHFRHQGGTGDRFAGGGGRLRATERAQKALRLSPSSCLNLIGAAQVGKSSLTGMRVLHRLGGRIPVWPFDPVPATGPVIVEIYTSLAARAAGLRAGRSKMRDGVALDAALGVLGSRPHSPLPRYDDHATDAILTAAWLRRAAGDAALWSPAGMTPRIAATEGWTFGVP